MSDSLKKRFSYKLGTNFVGLIVSLVVAGIVPRGLGPADYGNFSFLTDFFARVFNFFDTGTSTAFYTKLSKHPNRQNIIRFYWIYVGIVIISVLLFTIILFFTTFKIVVWPDQKELFIFLAFLFAVLTWINNITYKIIDAYSLTAKGEIVKISQKIIQAGLIFAMFGLGILTLLNYFVFNYIVLLILIISFSLIIQKNGISIFPTNKLRKKETKAYASFFYKYSSPLIIFSLFALVEGILDRWFLQTYAGSAQQGFYGLSLRISSLCFLFSSAMMPLILREFSIAFQENDNKKIKELFLKYVPLFYFIAGFIAIFTALNSDKISLILGGSEFNNAKFTIMIMALYPIHQTLGQFNGSYFLATDNTKLYSSINIFFLVIGVPLTFFLVAPTNILGLNLGSIGLATKMVIIQLIGVNVELWFISKILKFSFRMIIFRQFIIVGILLLSSLISVLISDYFINNIYYSFLLSAVSYIMLLFALIWLFPSLLSLKRAQLGNLLLSIYNKLLKRG